MGHFGSPTAEIGSLVWGTPANFNEFCVLAALLRVTVVVGASQLCGVEQRAPPIFGRAAIAQRDGRDALPNISGALCSMPQSLADAHY